MGIFESNNDLYRNKREQLIFINLISIFFLLCFFNGCKNGQKPIEITSKVFEEEILKNQDIEKINVVNLNLVEVYVKDDQLSLSQNNKTLKQKPQYLFNIDSIENFEHRLAEAQKAFSDNERINITYELRANLLKTLIWQTFPFLIILGMVFSFLWIIFLVEISNSDFKKTRDKLNWKIIITVIPFLGFILYLTIGRKQKLEKTTP